MPMADVEAPSGTVFAWEHYERSISCPFNPLNPATAPGHFGYVHQLGTTMLFCDGHVKRYVASQLRQEMFTYWREPTE